MRVELRMLGQIKVTRDGTDVAIGGTRQRAVLAALMADVGQFVMADELIERVWGPSPPRGARGALRSYLSRLRTKLKGVGEIEVAAGDRVGYRLVLRRAMVDASAFRDHCLRAYQSQNPDEALAHLDEAFARWPHGHPPLHGVDTPWAASFRTALDDERRSARLKYCELLIGRGKSSSVVSALKDLAFECPFDERTEALLLRALRGAGRRAEGLWHYEETRRRFADELGADPGPELCRLHLQLLDCDDGADAEITPEPGVTVETGSLDQPPNAGEPTAHRATLPPPPPDFVGRGAELRTLDRLAARRPGQILAVSGQGGIGKTSLVLQWARKVDGHFPDGQLYVDLEGFHRSNPPLATDSALRSLVEMLGVPPLRVPSETGAIAALFRAKMAGRRILLILDNARDSAQVESLLPGDFPGAVVVTSRNRLTGLVIGHDAQPIDVQSMTPGDAGQLLRQRVEPASGPIADNSAWTITHACDGLPLAISAVAARIATSPYSADRIADELRVEEPTGALLSSAEPGSDENRLAGVMAHSAVREALDSSIQALSSDAARALRLLSWYPGADVGIRGAASLIGCQVTLIDAVLDELLELHLIGEREPGRYAMHSLVQGYARDLSSQDDVRCASLRILAYYVQSAVTACQLYGRDFLPFPQSDLVPGVSIEPMSDRNCAVVWLKRERWALANAPRLARDRAGCRQAWRLVAAIAEFQDYESYWRDMKAGLEIGYGCAENAGEALGRAHIHYRLARLGLHNGDLKYSQEQLSLALGLFEAEDDSLGMARTHANLSWVMTACDERSNALDHALRALEIEWSLPQGRPVAAQTRLASAFIGAGQHEEATYYAQRALDDSRREHDLPNEAAAAGTLAIALEQTGELQGAVAASEHEAHVLRRLRKPQFEMLPLIRLCILLDRAGDEAKAKKFLAATRQLAGELGLGPDSRLPDGSTVPEWVYTSGDDEPSKRAGKPSSAVTTRLQSSCNP